MRSEAVEVGIFHPTMMAIDCLEAGEVGYIATGLKDVARRARRRHHHLGRQTGRPSRCPATKPAKSMVFAGLYPTNGEDYPLLREALERLEAQRRLAGLRARKLGGARASASAAAFWACCTWRSSASAWSASTTSSC